MKKLLDYKMTFLKFNPNSAWLFLVACLLAIYGCLEFNKERSNQSGGRNYYISPSGNDSYTGTKEKPWQSIERINKHSFKPGDSILFKGGITHYGTITLGNDDAATAGQKIVVSSYGNSRATIDGGDTTALYVDNCDHLVIANLNFSGSGRLSGNNSDGILISESDSISISEVEVRGFQHSGIKVYKSTGSSITKSVAMDNGFAGIFVSGQSSRPSGQYDNKHISISYCSAENNPGDPTMKDNHSGNGILVAGAQDVLIDHCTATNNGWDMPRQGNGPVGIWAYQSDSVMMQYCISYKNKTSEGGKDGGGFDFDGGMTNSIIQYCLSYENQGAGYGLFQYRGADNWSNNQIRYCVSINDGRITDGAGGIFIWNGEDDASELRDGYVYNNVIYNEYKPAVVFEPESDHIDFYFSNNIFLGSGDLVAGPSSGEKFLGNVWWKAKGDNVTFRGYQNLEAWSKATLQEKINGNIVGLQTDPMFAGPMHTNITDPDQLHLLTGYQLLDGTPIKNRGVNLKDLFNSDLPKHDFFGNTIVQGSAMEPGIFEMNE